MNLFKDVSSGENIPQEINVVVEIPKGTQNKIEYDEENGYMTLDRTLYSPLIYPFEYGFIPQTRSGDGDSLDAILLATNPTFPGCVVKARPVAVMYLEDEGGIDNKIIFAPTEKLNPRFKEIQNLESIPEHTRKEIQEFFEVIKRLEPNKWQKVSGWAGKEEAEKMIKEAIEKYKAE